MKICVFCSSSHGLDEMYLNCAREMGAAIAAHGHELVFGGYDQGLMGAVAHAAADAGAPVTSITTEGLTAKGRTVVPGTTIIEKPDLGQRIDEMIRLSDAFVTLPGGLGTFEEFFKVVSKVKAGELSAPSAILNVDGYFNPLAELLDDACARGLNSTDWRATCQIFEDADALITWLEQHVS